MKFCKDCKYYTKANLSGILIAVVGLHLCYHTDEQSVIYLVTGVSSVPTPKNCTSERSEAGGCGAVGNYWEPK